MGKRKRSNKETDLVESLLKQVKKLTKKRKRRISSSSSDDEIPVPLPDNSTQDHLASDLEIPDEIPINEPPIEGEVEKVVHDDLDPDILELLGSDPTQQKSFGDNLHKDLATRWKHILLNGLQKDEKHELLKQYLPAENCTSMKAPLINSEVKSALSEIHVKKDSYSEQKQNQMSSCISAIGKAMNLALLQAEIPTELIKTLSNAGRLLCDTHYRESISRRYAIVNSLSKQKRDTLKTTKIDEYLFGSNLTEHLKSSKAISTSAAELRFNINNNRLNQLQRPQPSTSSNRNPRTLNVRGAPRTPAKARVYPNQARRPQPPPPPPTARDYRPATMTSRARPNYAQTTQRR